MENPETNPIRVIIERSEIINIQNHISSIVVTHILILGAGIWDFRCPHSYFSLFGKEKISGNRNEIFSLFNRAKVSKDREESVESWCNFFLGASMAKEKVSYDCLQLYGMLKKHFLYIYIYFFNALCNWIKFLYRILLTISIRETKGVLIGWYIWDGLMFLGN